MMIRYARERGYKGEGRDPHVTLGRAYVVLGVVFRPAPYATQVCICTDADTKSPPHGQPYSDGGPALFDMNFFDIVDPRIPAGWSMMDHGRGYYRLNPDEFGSDFWDRYHDADPDAEATFESVVGKLYAFHAGVGRI